MNDDLRTNLLDELAPTPDALARMRVRVNEDMNDRARPAPRRRRPSLRIGIAIAGAVAVALLVALSPFDADPEHHGIPATTTAQAALERAAQSAANEQWAPLAPGEYHHTMSTSFDPTIPKRMRDTDTGRVVAGLASSTEVFLSPDGHGMQLRVDGGNGSPDAYLEPSPPDRHGRITGFGSRDPNVHVPQGDTQDQLRYAYFVDVSAWPRSGGRPYRRLWFRTPDGFKTGAPMPGGAIPKPGLSLGQRFQRDIWGAPGDVIDDLNESHGDKLERLLDPVLRSMPDGEIAVVGPIAQGDYEETTAWFQSQVEVQNAVKLLGRAPLAPHVRRALFERLAAQDHATIEHSVTDRRGRTGTRVTFEWQFDETVPAYTVTREQLRQDAKLKQQPWEGAISGADAIRVPEHHSIGRWYDAVIFDESTGSVLQHDAYSDWKTTVDLPRIGTTNMSPRGGGWKLTIRHSPGWYGSLDGTLFDVRERTTAITHLQSTACRVTPAMCRE
jgi:hypothetical protein